MSSRLALVGIALALTLGSSGLAPTMGAPGTPGVSGSPGQPGEGPDTLGDRARWFAGGRAASDGMIPFGARNRSLQQLETNTASGQLEAAARALPGTSWAPIGPAPLMGSSTSYSGRVSSLALDPSTPSTVYVGGASGGLWKTINSGTSWTPLIDDRESLSVGALAIDVGNPSTVYAGTGEWHFSCDSYFGAGILKSNDAGGTWALIGEAEFAGTAVSSIIISPTDPDVLWAANARGAGGFICVRPEGTYGVWRSLDGGLSWTQVLGSSHTGNDANTTSLLIDPVDPDVLYAGVAGPVRSGDTGDPGGVYKSTDGGSTWSRLVTGLPTSNVARVNLAIDPADRNRLFVAIQRTNSGSLYGVWRTTDGGGSWTQAGGPGSACSSYCWYCMILAIAPDGAVWFGGVDLYRSGNDGGTWTSRMTSGLHVDQHALVFDPTGKVWSGNDGGIFSSTNNGASWASHNAGLYLTQIYPGASLHPTNPDFALAGTQDNGTVRFAGSLTWDRILGGDGAFSAIDPVRPDTDWYASSQRLYLFKTTDAGDSWDLANLGIDTSDAPFIAPYVMCPGDATVLIAGTHRVWRTDNAGSSWSSNGPDWGEEVRTLAFSPSDETCSTYFACLKDGRVMRSTGGGPVWTEITGTLPGRGVNDLAVDPADGNVVYAALTGFGGSHLYRTDDALAADPIWIAADAGVPDTPVNAVLVDPTDPDVVLIGTDIGVFRSDDRGISWAVFNDGLPNVVVHDLVAVAATDSVVAFTHGRGAFRLAEAPFFADGFESGDTSGW